MKKLIAILLCLVMVVSMVACGGEKNPPPTDEKVITIGFQGRDRCTGYLWFQLRHCRRPLF